MKVNGKVVVVTGAGSGMGRALTLDLVKRGARVAAIDLNEETLAETKELAGESKGKISTHVMNITDHEAIKRLPEELKEIHGPVDALINNAGIIQPFVDVNDLDFEKIRQVMDVNFYGTLYFVKAFLPGFLERPEAHIVNVSSMGGFLPVPGQSIYGASKAAVKLMTEGLHSELKDTTVHVTVVFPGATNTNISENSQAEREMTPEDLKRMDDITSAEEAAHIILEGMEHNDYRILVGKDTRMMDKLYRLAPKKAAEMIAKKMKR
ncbi:SDR family NAD(P)-dependent oxidoreductase [Lacticigenium naphthae]|uniref:SDR family NAD(P)-dependent oxidoreductase n=1 Tax=Lacticigenium naphthae TaxID=515351 RepID=UPI00040D74BD|nr:SDR family oxidoreductase [Lacticigenium naphthae]